MHPSHSSLRSTWGQFLALLCLGWFCSAATPARADHGPWQESTAAERASLKNERYPEASVEILLSEISYDSNINTSWISYYRRIKIYNESGIAASGVLQIEYFDNEQARDFAARVTKPDGRKQELGEKDFTDIEASKNGSYQRKRKTLIVPGLAQGDILELTWTVKETSSDNVYTWAFCQERVPVREFRLNLIRPKFDCNGMWFNVEHVEQRKIGKKGTVIIMHDLPPYESEPYSPPMRDARGWYCLAYANDFLTWNSIEEVWEKWGKWHAEEFEGKVSPTGSVRSQAEKLTAGAKDDEDKLRRLDHFCRTEIRNLDVFDNPEMQKLSKKLSSRTLPSEVLSLRAGEESHINELFASMAMACGYPVRLVWLASKDAFMKVKIPQGWMFLDNQAVAVQLPTGWKMYSPGSYFEPCGMLRSELEMVDGLRCEKENSAMMTTPVSAASLTVMELKARLVLNEDGDATGEIEETWGGHKAASFKRSWNSHQLQELDDELDKGLKERLGGAETEGITWTGLHEPAVPVTLRYKITVKGYATRLGNKLTLNPSFFRQGSTPYFTSQARKQAIFFPYAWNESDDVEIVIPEGLELVKPTSPPDIGDLAAVVGVQYKLGFKAKSRTLSYRRKFSLGANGSIAFQPASYQGLKALFDRINRADSHVLMLAPRQTPGSNTDKPQQDSAPAATK